MHERRGGCPVAGARTTSQAQLAARVPQRNGVAADPRHCPLIYTLKHFFNCLKHKTH